MINVKVRKQRIMKAANLHGSISTSFYI